MQLRIVTPAPFNASTPLAALREDLTPPRLHYVRDHFRRPEARQAWSFGVGNVARPGPVDVHALARLPQRDLVVTMECAGNSRTRMHPVPPGTPWDDGAVSTARWSGVALRDVLLSRGLLPGAREVLFRGADSGREGGREIAYERSLPLDVALHPDTLLVTSKDGAPLPLQHGGPVRLLVPGWYGMASVKWLAAIEVLDRPFAGFFQKDRYVDARGAPVSRVLPKSIVLAPGAGDEVRAGATTRVEGKAWAAAGVAGVEVSVDAGASWTRATLGPSLGAHAWRAFSLAWTPTERGAHVLVARCTDAEGATQPLEPVWNPLGYANNAVVPVTVNVA